MERSLIPCDIFFFFLAESKKKHCIHKWICLFEFHFEPHHEKIGLLKHQDFFSPKIVSFKRDLQPVERLQTGKIARRNFTVEFLWCLVYTCIKMMWNKANQDKDMILGENYGPPLVRHGTMCLQVCPCSMSFVSSSVSTYKMMWPY